MGHSDSDTHTANDFINQTTGQYIQGINIDVRCRVIGHALLCGDVLSSKAEGLGPTEHMH